jgi:hypothetical protein
MTPRFASGPSVRRNGTSRDGTRWEWRRRKTTPFARPTGQRHDRDLHQDRHGRPHGEPTAGADCRAILAGRPRSTCSQEML